ncbi:transposase, partial [Candidatus Falkowbacteria bacterium]|nr:transposase [Candidatus Falkowbacteria bacterium]
YLKGYQTIHEARDGLTNFFDFYNYKRPHQSLGYKTPNEIYSSLN